jgi:hypothetical protein
MFLIGIGIGIRVGNIQQIPKVKFDLLENGLDFISEAVIEINKSSDHKRLKYSLIHLSSGIELIFKEVLRNKDWRLLFQELKDASADKLESGDFESIKFKKLIPRLESECKINFSENDKELIEEIRIKRNKIEHFKMNERVSSVRGLCSKTLKFIIPFINQNIDLSKTSTLSNRYIQSLTTELSKLKH